MSSILSSKHDYKKYIYNLQFTPPNIISVNCEFKEDFRCWSAIDSSDRKDISSLLMFRILKGFLDGENQDIYGVNMNYENTKIVITVSIKLPYDDVLIERTITLLPQPVDEIVALHKRVKNLEKEIDMKFDKIDNQMSIILIKLAKINRKLKEGTRKSSW
jgi:hypothetical protein